MGEVEAYSPLGRVQPQWPGLETPAALRAHALMTGTGLARISADRALGVQPLRRSSELGSWRSLCPGSSRVRTTVEELECSEMSEVDENVAPPPPRAQRSMPPQQA
ncbi:hypothetical protein LTR53_013072, partial [Teratosphaeriaceae sp. CCFEE 6253]